MRGSALLCAIVTFAPRAAGAQPEPASREAQLRSERVELETRVGGGELHWSLEGQLSGAAEQQGGAGVAVADAAVLAELVIDDELCSLVVAGGQLRAYREAGERGLSAEQWASVCFMSDGLLPSLQLRHHLEADVRPAFSAPRTLRRRRYRRETIGFDLVEFRFPFPEYDAQLEFAHLELGVSFALQDAGDEEPEALEADVDVAMLRWLRRRPDDPALSVDVFGFHVAEVDDDYYTLVMEFSPVRLRGVHLGAGLYLDADVAWAHGSVSEANTAESLPLRQYDTVSGDVAVERRRGPVWFGARYRRRFAPTIDTDLILEDRASAWASTARGRLDGTLRGFGAVTRLYRNDGEALAPELTGGVELVGGYDLGRGLRLGAAAEVARTYYARIDADPEPRPELAMRIVGLLSARFGR